MNYNKKNMTKSFIVAGATWLAEVDIENAENIAENEIKVEAITRAVEAHFGKRKDIQIHKNKKIKPNKKDKDTLHNTLIQLLTDELEPGCGVGMLFCIMDNQDPATYKEGEEHEWYMASNQVLANAGMHKLVNRFNMKYPDKKIKNKKKA